MKATEQRTYWESPITASFEQPPDPNAPKTPKNHDDVMIIWRRAVSAGFGENAIVVKRHSQPHMCMLPYNWGIIVDIQKHCAWDWDKYKPLKVRWFSNGTTDVMNMEELFLIQDPIREDVLRGIIDSQSPPWEKK